MGICIQAKEIICSSRICNIPVYAEENKLISILKIYPTLFNLSKNDEHSNNQQISY